MFELIDTGRGVQSSWMLLYSNMFQLEKYAICEPQGTNKAATGEMPTNASAPNAGGIIPNEIIVFRVVQFAKAPEGIACTFSPIFTVTIGLVEKLDIEEQLVA